MNKDFANYQNNAKFLLEDVRTEGWDDVAYNAAVAALLKGLSISLAREAAHAEISMSMAIHY